MTLGRPPIKGRMTTTYSILFPDADFIPKLDEIAKSQSTSRRKYIISVLQKAIDAYEQEGQTGLKDYVEGSPLTDNLIFLRCVNRLQNQKEISRKDIFTLLRDYGIEPSKVSPLTDKAVIYLKNKGVRVSGATNKMGISGFSQ